MLRYRRAFITLTVLSCHIFSSAGFSFLSSLKNDPQIFSSISQCDSRHNRYNICRRAATQSKLYAEGNDSNYSGGKARFSSGSGIGDSSSSVVRTNLNVIDSTLNFLVSDFGSIAFGIIGIFICLWNRLGNLDADSISDSLLGEQARSDLLAVFATMAVFLNGVSKLDVTSALAETVLLEGEFIRDTEITQTGKEKLELLGSKENNNLMMSSDIKKLTWCMQSILDSTPAKTSVLMLHDSNSNWTPIAYSGIVPYTQSKRETAPLKGNTPILDRFLKMSNDNAKESYLPTLQALPGKVEFTYLPANTQEVLILPISVSSEKSSKEEAAATAVLVLGSDTAKSFSPRDISWSIVLGAKLKEVLFTSQ